MKRVLIAGESWISHTTHIKGFDTFNTTVYEEGVNSLRQALMNGGYEVDFLPNHLASEEFPTEIEKLSEYSCVILSDIGSNTLLISKASFEKSKKCVNRCELIKEYVANGGAFMMIGGYMSFCGIDAKSRYGQTAIADILPVGVLDIDDRVESPEGITPVVVDDGNSLFKDINGEWPHFLGYNKTMRIEQGEVLATINDDPFIAVREYKKGKSAVFTSDCAPHWGPPKFVNWEHYDRLWQNILGWLVDR